MSRFYMSHTSDNRKEVTRQGLSNMYTHLRGWNTGIKVECSVNSNGNNVYRVYKTGGSNDPSFKENIYEYEEV